jgi:hypothetical protein
MPVEFLSHTPDEPDPGPPEPSRHVPLLRVGAALAVLAALVVWALTRPEGTDHRAAAAHPSTSAPAVTTPGPVTVVAFHCTMGAPLDNEIESAMWHYFHGIAIRNLGVFRCIRGSGPSGRVLFQAVSGRYHGVNIDLEARLRTVHGVGADLSPHLGSAHSRYPLLARIKAISVNLDVTVNAYGRRGAAVPGDRMRKLCDFVSLNVVL